MSVSLSTSDQSGVCLLRPLRERSSLAFFQREHGQSPRAVLTSAMKSLRRAAEERKYVRIARRLNALAEGKVERVTWSSRMSLRG